MASTYGKQYRAAATKRAIETAYVAKQALELVKTGAFAKFDETVEVACVSAWIRGTPTRWCAAPSSSRQGRARRSACW